MTAFVDLDVEEEKEARRKLRPTSSSGWPR